MGSKATLVIHLSGRSEEIKLHEDPPFTEICTLPSALPAIT